MSDSKSQPGRQYWLVYCPNIARDEEHNPILHATTATKKLVKPSNCQGKAAVQAENQTSENVCIGRRFTLCQACKAFAKHESVKSSLTPREENFVLGEKRVEKEASLLQSCAIEVIQAFNKSKEATGKGSEAKSQQIPTPSAAAQDVPVPQRKYSNVGPDVGNRKPPTPTWKDVFREPRIDDDFRRMKKNWENYKAENVKRDKYRTRPKDDKMKEAVIKTTVLAD